MTTRTTTSLFPGPKDCIKSFNLSVIQKEGGKTIKKILHHSNFTGEGLRQIKCDGMGI